MTTVLHIYKAPSGQWAGKFIQDGEELGRVAGCESAQDVEEAAHDNGIEFAGHRRGRQCCHTQPVPNHNETKLHHDYQKF
jgi:hypothetical protein